jgi:hypothetical protein
MTTSSRYQEHPAIENRRYPLVLAAVLVIWVCAFAFASSAWGATARGSTGVAVEVRPAAELSVASDQVTVRIRLAPGVVAQVWFDNTCSSPAPGAVTINASGTHEFSLRNFNSNNNQDVSGRVCLLSSDGQLRAAAPVAVTSSSAD